MSENAEAFFCPKCSSASVLRNYITGEASCDGCAWKGQHRDLLTYKFKTGFKSETEMLEVLGKDIRNLFARHVAADVGRLLIKWGFVTPPIHPSTLARYFSAMGSAIVTALIEERKKIEKGESLGPRH